MTKEMTTKLLTGGLVVGELAEQGSFVLVYISKKQKFIVPCLNILGVCTAYISPKYDTSIQSKLLELVKETLDTRMFSIFSIGSYTPKIKEAPVFSKHIISWIKPLGMSLVIPNTIIQFLEEEGYNVPEEKAAPKSAYQKRDYGTQIEDNPEFKEQYEKEKALLDGHGVTFESLPKQVQIEFNSIMAGAPVNLLLVGPSGTGKSWINMALSVFAKAHREEYQLTPNSLEEDLEGKLLTSDDPNIKGNWKFEEGPLLKAYYLGYIFQAGELSRASGGILSTILKYTDGHQQVVVNGKVYKRHPNFVFLADMNNAYLDTVELDEAIKSRFKKIYIPPLSLVEFTNRLIKHAEYIGMEISSLFCSKLYDFTNFMKKKAKEFHEREEITIRNAQGLLESMLGQEKDFETFKNAIYTNYMDGLTCDNDNGEKLTALKNDIEIENLIRTVFSEYTSNMTSVVDESLEDFESIFDEVETNTSKTYALEDEEKKRIEEAFKDYID